MSGSGGGDGNGGGAVGSALTTDDGCHCSSVGFSCYPWRWLYYYGSTITTSPSQKEEHEAPAMKLITERGLTPIMTLCSL